MAMYSLSSSKLLTSALSALVSLSALSPAAAAPVAAPQYSSTPSSSGYWLGQNSFHLNAPVWGNPDSGYQLYRNVKDYGATGDGSTDDTNAINAAMADGNRCMEGCNSSTTSPAMVYFPSGTYMVHAPIIMPYYTQVVGDATDLPTIKATQNFSGMAVLDSDPYGNYGVNWYINQNNFFRQVRNFIIDITEWGNGATGAGIHWQVAQATSLQNIVFEMSTSAGTKQQGIFMDNGSGGWMSDLTFNGGLYGAFLGNQQFTSRNWVFNGCQTGIYMNWNWGWTLSNMTFNNCGTGIDMSNSPANQTVGSVVLSDSTFTNTRIGVKSAYNLGANVPTTGGTLVIDNTQFGGATPVTDPNGNTIEGSNIDGSTWISGNVYSNSATAAATQGQVPKPVKAAGLLNNGNIFGKSKPQYENAASSDFLSAKAQGCKGDATTDDTLCIQNFLKQAASTGQIAYFDHGVYKVTDTIQVPDTINIVGEVWSTILASGFNDASSPKPVWQVGAAAGSQGAVQISDMLFEILGPNPGAIMIQWNLQSTQGASGMWDTHVRIGGSYGSELLLANCPKQLNTNNAPTSCEGAFMMFYASPESSNVYLENTWFWTADHDMEDPLNQQISVYNGRGMLIRSAGPVWLWGTSSEHSIIYNYQFDGVHAVFAGFMQSETPYFQPGPEAPAPLTFNSAYDDPTFTICTSNSKNVPCQDSWGLRIVNSNNVLIYSTGFYSFFNDYTQDCLAGESCQLNMIRIQGSSVDMFAVTTKAAVNMIADDNGITVKGAANQDVYGQTIARYNPT